MKELVLDRISSLKGKFKSPKCKVLNQSDVKNSLEILHAVFVLVPPIKQLINLIVVCKKYYIETLVKELGISTSSNANSTHIPCTESYDDMLRTHGNSVSSVSLEMSEEDKNLPYLYWTLNVVIIMPSLSVFSLT